MQLQSFMQRLKESEWIKGDAHQYALSGELQVEELNPAELQDFPEIIYIRSKRDYLVGRIDRRSEEHTSELQSQR